MDRKQYDSAGARQSRYTPEFGRVILQNMAAPKISEVIPAEELLAVHRAVSYTHLPWTKRRG